ncbi:unnamed protein product, partial [Rotaria magnacalcarata]
QVLIVRFELSQSRQTICIETFKHFPELGRFILRDASQIVVVGRVVDVIE